MVTDKMKAVGLTNTSTHCMWRGEFIYVQNGKYYPTICNGYKDAACCNTLAEAQEWINAKKTI